MIRYDITRGSVPPLLNVLIHPFQLPTRWNLTRPKNFT
jgi:hypothetical protein